MSSTSLWPGMSNPDHSRWYIQRFRTMAQRGEDLDGEARMVNAMVPRGSRIMDAGSGPGRTGGYLAAAGHDVVGVDIDPLLIEAAQQDHPNATWITADLTELNLPEHGEDEPFDAIVAAGNVLAFIPDGLEVRALQRLAGHLKMDGFIAIGFGLNRGLTLADFDEYVDRAGFMVRQRFSTWDIKPWDDSSHFAVTILAHKNTVS